MLFPCLHLHIGSFKAPYPGRPKSELPPASDLLPGQKLDNLNDPIARKHYRLVAIIPEEVELLDLVDYEKPQRIKWTFVADEKGGYGGDGLKGRWDKVELWP